MGSRFIVDVLFICKCLFSISVNVMLIYSYLIQTLKAVKSDIQLFKETRTSKKKGGDFISSPAKRKYVSKSGIC